MNQLGTRLESVSGGTLRRISNIGLRPLAYRMTAHGKKNTTGRYLKVNIQANPLALRDFEKRLHADEEIVRVMTIRQATIAPRNDVEAFNRLPDTLNARSEEEENAKTSTGQTSLLRMTDPTSVSGGSSYQLPNFQLRDLQLPFADINLLQHRTLIDYFAARTLLQYGVISKYDIESIERHRPDEAWDKRVFDIRADKHRLQVEADERRKLIQDSQAETVNARAERESQQTILYDLTHLAVKEKAAQEREIEKEFQLKLKEHRKQVAYDEYATKRCAKLVRKQVAFARSRGHILTDEQITKLEANQRKAMDAKQSYKHNLVKSTIINTDTETDRLIKQKRAKMTSSQKLHVKQQLDQAQADQRKWRQRSQLEPIQKMMDQAKQIESNDDGSIALGSNSSATGSTS